MVSDISNILSVFGKELVQRATSPANIFTCSLSRSIWSTIVVSVGGGLCQWTVALNRSPACVFSAKASVIGATSSTLRLADFLYPVLVSTPEDACTDEGVPDTDDETGELLLSIFAVVPPFSHFHSLNQLSMTCMFFVLLPPAMTAV